MKRRVRRTAVLWEKPFTRAPGILATVLQTLVEKRFFIKCLCCDCALHAWPLEWEGRGNRHTSLIACLATVFVSGCWGYSLGLFDFYHASFFGIKDVTCRASNMAGKSYFVIRTSSTESVGSRRRSEPGTDALCQGGDGRDARCCKLFRWHPSKIVRKLQCRKLRCEMCEIHEPQKHVQGA